MKHLLLLVLTIALTASSAHAWDFGVPEKFAAKDSQVYLTSVSRSHQSLGTGACFGPIARLTHNEQRVADFLSVCGYVQAQLQEQDGSQASGAFGFGVLDFFGLQFAVAYDPIVRNDADQLKDRLLYGVGLSITDLISRVTN